MPVWDFPGLNFSQIAKIVLKNRLKMKNSVKLIETIYNITMASINEMLIDN